MIDPAKPVKSEEADDYHAIVARLNDNWRVIVCAAGMQWILQRGYPARNHGDVRWRSRSFCRTAEALNRVSREHAGPIEAAALLIMESLPARIDEPDLAIPLTIAATMQIACDDGQNLEIQFIGKTMNAATGGQ